jgi:MFS superfamily sulfate permease-like transporter
MLVFVVFFPFVIHQIPLSALAAILIYTGYRLASPKQFSHSLHIGFEQLAIFCTTLIFTLATDLIIGVGSGIVLKFVIHLFRGAAFKSLFTLRKEIQEFDTEYRVTITHSATFSNYLHLKGLIDKSPKNKTIVIDLSDATLVDHTDMDHQHHFQESFKREGRTLEIVGLHYLKPMGKHPLAARLKVSSLAK